MAKPEGGRIQPRRSDPDEVPAELGRGAAYLTREAAVVAERMGLTKGYDVVIVDEEEGQVDH